ncbi:MAG: hypothetical protein ACLQLG_19765 [Thermoguttaceae bacterium]
MQPAKLQDLTATTSPVCTRVCTSNLENANADALDADQGSIGERLDADQGTEDEAADADPLAKLAAAVLSLSPADRERLAAMLTGHQGEAEGKADLPPALGSSRREKPN